MCRALLGYQGRGGEGRGRCPGGRAVFLRGRPGRDGSAAHGETDGAGFGAWWHAEGLVPGEAGLCDQHGDGFRGTLLQQDGQGGTAARPRHQLSRCPRS